MSIDNRELRARAAGPGDVVAWMRADRKDVRVGAQLRDNWKQDYTIPLYERPQSASPAEGRMGEWPDIKPDGFDAREIAACDDIEQLRSWAGCMRRERDNWRQRALDAEEEASFKERLQTDMNEYASALAAERDAPPADSPATLGEVERALETGRYYTAKYMERQSPSDDPDAESPLAQIDHAIASVRALLTRTEAGASEAAFMAVAERLASDGISPDDLDPNATVTEHRAQCRRCGDFVAIAVPTPNEVAPVADGAVAEPFAWFYEELYGHDDSAWIERFGKQRPCWTHRNAIPLYTHPQDASAGVDWREMYRFQTAMRYMDNVKHLTTERANKMADEDVARLEAAPHQPAKGGAE